MKIAKNVTELIGNTPMVHLSKISKQTGANIIAKCEFLNPTSSVKDRIGFSMIDTAFKDGLINKGTTIIEPTSGNTGIALASTCAALDLKLILVMPESMSVERRKLLLALGAQLILTPANQGMIGSMDKAKQLHEDIPNSIILQQFSNPANPKIHEKTTAVEILKDTGNQVDLFVASVGTGGTLSGIGKVLKQKLKDVKIVAVEPKNSAILSKGKAGPHKIQGIGAGFIPDNLNMSVYDEVITVSDEDAICTAKELALREGLLVGISSGANVYAAMQLASRKEFKNKTIVTVLCDTAERYLSTSLFDE